MKTWTTSTYMRHIFFAEENTKIVHDLAVQAAALLAAKNCNKKGEIHLWHSGVHGIFYVLWQMHQLWLGGYEKDLLPILSQEERFPEFFNREVCTVHAPPPSTVAHQRFQALRYVLTQIGT